MLTNIACVIGIYKEIESDTLTHTSQSSHNQSDTIQLTQTQAANIN